MSVEDLADTLKYPDMNYVDTQALKIAEDLADEHGVADPKIIALMQLSAAEGIKHAFDPYPAFSQVVESPRNIDRILGVVHEAKLPQQRWSCGFDNNGVMLTLGRQRTYIARAIKEAFAKSYIKTEVKPDIQNQLLSALKLARGWIVTCSSSRKARADLAIVDKLLELHKPKCTCLSELEEDAYEPGGLMSGKPKPPPCVLHSSGKM